MKQYIHDADEPPFTNAMQIIIMNVVLTLSLALSLSLTFTWSLIPAFLVGWIGGCILTLFLLAGLYALSSMRQTRPLPVRLDDDPAALARAGDISMWEEDASDDQWQSLAAHGRMLDAASLQDAPQKQPRAR